jgi:hypothetical protein
MELTNRSTVWLKKKEKPDFKSLHMIIGLLSLSGEIVTKISHYPKHLYLNLKFNFFIYNFD